MATELVGITGSGSMGSGIAEVAADDTVGHLGRESGQAFHDHRR